MQSITGKLCSHVQKLLATGLLLSLAGCASVTQQAVAELEKSERAGKYDEAISLGRSSIEKVCKEKDASTCQAHKRSIFTKIGDIQLNNLTKYAEAEASYLEALNATPRYPNLMADASYRKNVQTLYRQISYTQSKQQKWAEMRKNFVAAYYTDPTAPYMSETYRNVLEQARQTELSLANAAPPAKVPAPSKNKKRAKKPQPAPSIPMANPQLQEIELELQKVTYFKTAWDTLQSQLNSAQSSCPPLPATTNSERQTRIEQYKQNICVAEKRETLTLALQNELNRKFGTHSYGEFIAYSAAQWKSVSAAARNEISSEENWQRVEKAAAGYAYNQCQRNGNCTPSQIAAYRETMANGQTTLGQELSRAGEDESMQALRQQQAEEQRQAVLAQQQTQLEQQQRGQEQRQQWEAQQVAQQQQAQLRLRQQQQWEAQQQAQQQAQMNQQRQMQEQQQAQMEQQRQMQEEQQREAQLELQRQVQEQNQRQQEEQRRRQEELWRIQEEQRRIQEAQRLAEEQRRVQEERMREQERVGEASSTFGQCVTYYQSGQTQGNLYMWSYQNKCNFTFRVTTNCPGEAAPESQELKPTNGQSSFLANCQNPVDLVIRVYSVSRY